jgi:hypothetical protein
MGVWTTAWSSDQGAVGSRQAADGWQADVRYTLVCRQGRVLSMSSVPTLDDKLKCIEHPLATFPDCADWS